MISRFLGLYVLFASFLCAAEQWAPLPLLTAAQKAAGVAPGGEGCQYPSSLVADPIDGSLLLYGTDVGGIFRSDNGAKEWKPANLGWKANGSIAFAVDPRSIDRVLAVGSISGNQFVQADGVYLSVDKGRTWSQVLAVPRIELTHDQITMLAYDGSTYDAATKLTRTAYYALQSCPNQTAGIYRTDDGGVTWMKVADAEAFGGGNGHIFIGVPGLDGALIVGSTAGVFRSTDHGLTFAQINAPGSGEVQGLSTVPSAPGKIWISRDDGVQRSDDGGKTFAAIAHDGKISKFSRIMVSPADPQRIATHDQKDNERYISHDGGKTWAKAVAIYNKDEFIPDDTRTGFRDRNFSVAWHPKDPKICWATGPGDLLWRSDDGGLTFTWANNGINNIMIGGLFNFSASNPDVLYFGSQDYNGGLTLNAGKTWSFANLTVSYTSGAVRQGGNDSDGWGWVYGGYSPDGKILYGGNHEYQGNQHDLWISFDGGKTSEKKVSKLSGAQVSYSDPRDANVFFCWGWRSADRGRTWTQMNNCDGVFTASAAADRTMYGRNGKAVVRSIDHGVTWQTVTTLPADISDLAYDHIVNRVWATADKTLYACTQPGFAPISVNAALPKDHFDSTMVVTTVAVDPTDPRIVYVGALGIGLWVQRDATVARSLDGGATWERLTANPAYLENGWVTGGQMTSAVRVHPVTRRLYAATCCFGWWTFPPPAAEAVGKPVTDHRYQPAFAAISVSKVPDHSLPIAGKDGLAVRVVRDFGPAGFEYTFGADWKNDANVKPGDIAGTPCVIIDTTENGGAGIILGGVDLCPQGQTHLLISLHALPDNQAGGLSINLNGNDGKSRNVSISFEHLKAEGFSNVVVALPGAPSDYAHIEQIQIQGTNWSPGAKPLKIAIDRIGVTKPSK